MPAAGRLRRCARQLVAQLGQRAVETVRPWRAIRSASRCRPTTIPRPRKLAAKQLCRHLREKRLPGPSSDADQQRRRASGGTGCVSAQATYRMLTIAIYGFEYTIVAMTTTITSAAKATATKRGMEGLLRPVGSC